MDHPQWYNSKLWLTNRQNIDGHLSNSSVNKYPMNLHHAMRTQSASNYHGIRRLSNPNNLSGNINSINNNNDWNSLMKVNFQTTPIRDRNNIYRYHIPPRSTLKSAQDNHSLPLSKFYSSIQQNSTFKQPTNSQNPSILSLSTKPLTVKDNNVIPVTKPIQIKLLNKSYINPNYSENTSSNSEFSSLPTKHELVQGNLNLNSNNDNLISPNSPINQSNDLITVTESQNDTNSVHSEISDFNCIIKPPHNTPRFSLDSSHEKLPIKSILKKTQNSSNHLGYFHYNSNHNNNVNSINAMRTLSASSKPLLINPMISRNYTDNARKKLQSAPGVKRGVRFNMNGMNVIEY